MSKGVDQWLQCVVSVPLGYDGFRLPWHDSWHWHRCVRCRRSFNNRFLVVSFLHSCAGTPFLLVSMQCELGLGLIGRRIIRDRIIPSDTVLYGGGVKSPRIIGQIL